MHIFLIPGKLISFSSFKERFKGLKNLEILYIVSESFFKLKNLRITPIKKNKIRIKVEKIMLKKVFKTNSPTEFEYIPQKEVTNMQLKMRNIIPIRPYINVIFLKDLLNLLLRFE